MAETQFDLPANDIEIKKEVPTTKVPEKTDQAQQFLENVEDKTADESLLNAVLPETDANTETDKQIQAQKEIKKKLAVSYNTAAELSSLIAKDKAALVNVSGDREAPYLASIKNLLPIAEKNYKPLIIEINQRRREELARNTINKVRKAEKKLLEKNQVGELEKNTIDKIRGSVKKIFEEVRERSQQLFESWISRLRQIKQEPDTAVIAENFNEVGFVKKLEGLVRGETKLSNMDNDQLDQLQTALSTLLVLTRELSTIPHEGPKLTMNAVGDTDEKGNLRIDESRRRQDVKDIADNEYFQNLQKKAKQLRDERNNPTK